MISGCYNCNYEWQQCQRYCAIEFASMLCYSFNLSEERDALHVKCAGSVANVHQLRCSFEEQNQGWLIFLPFRVTFL